MTQTPSLSVPRPRKPARCVANDLTHIYVRLCFRQAYVFLADVAMSTLLQLPTELQFHMLSYLGPEFFRRDIRRLTISRSWYDVAWRVMVQHLRLTTRSLVKFTREVTVLTRSQACVTSVQLSLRDFEGARLSSARVDRREGGAQPRHANDVVEWTAQQLISSWETLAAMLQRCHSLRCLMIEEGPEDYELGLQQQGISMSKPLADLLSLGHLTHLEIDTTSCSSATMHLCCSINSSFPSLRRLRCRMGSICEKLLKPSTGDEPLIQLEEIIVNLSLSELSETITSYRYPKRCRPIPGETFLQLREAIETVATELSRKLSSPQMVRVISHELPSLIMYAFDALNGSRLRLGTGRLPWDTDGAVVDESDGEDETDLFDSDPSSPPEISF